MKNTILIFSLLFWAPTGFAQNISQNDVKVREKTWSTLCIIKLNGEELSTLDLIVGVSEIESLNILTIDQMKNNYPNNKADMVWEVTLKPNVKLLDIKQILDKYKIDPKYRNYMILDEDLKISDPNKMLASSDLLQDVVVNTDKQYINIITKFYQNTLKARKDAEAGWLKQIEEYRKLKNQ